MNCRVGLYLTWLGQWPRKKNGERGKEEILLWLLFHVLDGGE